MVLSADETAAVGVDLATPVGERPFGFQIGAAEIGGRASPPMRIIGPEREDEASEAHIGFWPHRAGGTI